MDPLSALEEVVSTAAWIITRLKATTDMDRDLVDLLVLVERVAYILEEGETQAAVAKLTGIAASTALKALLSAMSTLNRLTIEMQEGGLLAHYDTAGHQNDLNTSELRQQVQTAVTQLQSSMEFLSTATGVKLSQRVLIQLQPSHDAVSIGQEALQKAQDSGHAANRNINCLCEAAVSVLNAMCKRLVDLLTFVTSKVRKTKYSGLALATEETPCRVFKFADIMNATENFAPKNEIGKGRFGKVFKGVLHGMAVAVKVISYHTSALQGQRDFANVVRVLSSLQHPHIAELLGSCTNPDILVYRLPEGGCLEQRLLGPHISHQTSLPWPTRVRIAAQIAIALQYLVTSPHRIVHMDLNPSNIFLTCHGNVKLGDVGLAWLMSSHALPSVFRSSVPQHNTTSTARLVSATDTDIVGGLAYIDPEYMQSLAFSPLSDVYALGIVMLQLLTGMHVSKVHDAEEANQYLKVIDPAANGWPLEQAAAFANLALQCADVRRCSRPDLGTVVIPSLLELVSKSALKPPAPSNRDGHKDDGVPSMFVCPITHHVMGKPVVAADGHTYEQHAIQEWLSKHDTSPITNQRIPNKQLVPNHSIRSAIGEWLEAGCPGRTFWTPTVLPGSVQTTPVTSTQTSLKGIDMDSASYSLQCSWNKKLGGSTAFMQHKQMTSQEVNALGIVLASNTNLHHLDLQHSKLGPADAETLAIALGTNRMLLQLNLGHNDIGDDGATALATALSTNRTLQVLILYDNKVGPDGATSLARAVGTNNMLQRLELHCNNIGPEGAVALGQALQTNSTLQQLQLWGNGVGPEGAKALGKAVSTHSSLQLLYLGFNGIGPEGAKLLGAALSTNSTLQQLDLGGNGMGLEGATALATALKTNNILQHLDLQHNSIGDEGAKTLSAALCTNNALQRLALIGNNIGPEGARALGTALASNLSLQELLMGSNNIGYEDIQALCAASVKCHVHT